jgi:hypothetical protein
MFDKNIELMNGPRARDSQGEHGVVHCRLDHQAEGLIVVDTGSLGEAAKDPSSLLFQRVVRAELLLKKPFVSGEVGANGARDKVPGVVVDQGSKFFFHGTVPVRIDKGGTDGGGH